jgi:hypothetical protein
VRHSTFLRRHSLWAPSHTCQLHQTNAMLLVSTSVFVVKAVTTIKAFLNIHDVIMYFKSSLWNGKHQLTYCSNITLEIWVITVRTTSVFDSIPYVCQSLVWMCKTFIYIYMLLGLMFITEIISTNILHICFILSCRYCGNFGLLRKEVSDKQLI